MTTRGIATRGIFAAKTFALAIVIDNKSRYMFTDEFNTQWSELPQPVRDWYDTIGSFFFEMSNAIEHKCFCGTISRGQTRCPTCGNY